MNTEHRWEMSSRGYAPSDIKFQNLSLQDSQWFGNEEVQGGNFTKPGY